MPSLSSDSPYKLQVIKYALRHLTSLSCSYSCGLDKQRFRLHLCSQAAVSGQQELQACHKKVRLLLSKWSRCRLATTEDLEVQARLETWALSAEKGKVDAKAANHPMDVYQKPIRISPGKNLSRRKGYQDPTPTLPLL